MKQGRADKSGRESWKTEPKPHAIHESAVAQQGLAVQFQKKDLQAGEGYKPPGPKPAAAGPGGGRTIHRAGTQGRH